MALGAVAMALLAALLTPLGVVAAFVVMIFLWTLVQVTALRWWAPLALAAAFAVVLVARWDVAIADLDRSRKEQLRALFHPRARERDWGGRWRAWMAPTLWFALPAGCLAPRWSVWDANARGRSAQTTDRGRGVSVSRGPRGGRTRSPNARWLGAASSSASTSVDGRSGSATRSWPATG